MPGEDYFETLNTIYEPLYRKSVELRKVLKEIGMNSSLCFHNGHYVRKEMEWVMEYYPIPLLTISDICDIGFDISHIFVEFRLPRLQALESDFTWLQPFHFEVYGSEDFLTDYYHAGMEIEELKEELSKSREDTICVSVFFSSSAEIDTLREFITTLQAFL